jgi:C1A family cysteine protease
MRRTRRIAGLGWKPDLPDYRDHLFAVSPATMVKLPAKVDLRSKCPPVYDQGNIGSCTGNAIAGAIQFDRKRAKEKPNFVPSRLFIYYNERAMEGSVGYDAGATIRDGIKSVAKLGVCPEKMWTYDDTAPVSDGGPWPAGAKAGQKPDKACFATALDYQAIQYQRVTQTLSQLKGCLAQGFPFVYGFTVYDSLWDASGHPRKVIPLPSGRDQVAGGHAVVAVGYDDVAQRFIVRNSWGPEVQDKGYCYMPYLYVTNSQLASDFWVIRAIER